MPVQMPRGGLFTPAALASPAHVYRGHCSSTSALRRSAVNPHGPLTAVPLLQSSQALADAALAVYSLPSGPAWSRTGQARQHACQLRTNPLRHCRQAGNLALRAHNLPNNSWAAAELRKATHNRVTTQAAVKGARHRCHMWGKTCGRSQRGARRRGLGVQGRWAPAYPLVVCIALDRPRTPAGRGGRGATGRHWGPAGGAAHSRQCLTASQRAHPRPPRH